MSAVIPPRRPPRPDAPRPDPPRPQSTETTAAPISAERVLEPGAAGEGAKQPKPLGPMTLAEGTIVAGKYRLERALSRGAMGSVWVGTHLALETPVAIKFMSLDAPIVPSESEAAAPSMESRTRFEREAKAAAQVRSANVVQILDYGVDGATPYIVMELLQGEDLGARLKRVERMPLKDVAELVVAVGRALQRAHDVGLVHRDLKPGNIFLAKEGDDEVPKVLDFGVAKAVRGDRPLDEGTHEGTLVGTPSYMSPEQAMGRVKIDHRSDLWSLGVVAFRALTGTKPFPSDSLLEVVVQICTADAVRATDVAPELPRSVDSFFERALQRDPAERFQSAKEMAQALASLALDPSKAVISSRQLMEPGASGTFDVPIHVGENDETLDAPSRAAALPHAVEPPPAPAPSRRRNLLVLGAVACLALVTGIAWLAGRSPPPATATGNAPAASSAPVPTEPSARGSVPATEAPPVDSATAAAADTSTARAAARPPAAPPRTSVPRPPARPYPQPNAATKKPKFDPGY